MENLFVMSRKFIVCIFLYYIAFLLISLLIAIGIIVRADILIGPSETVFVKAMIGSLAMSGIGSSTYYIRKLYKLCIRDEVEVYDKIENSSNRMIGTILYFIIRPIFSLGFAIVVVLCIDLGDFVVSSREASLGDGFYKMCMFISFFAGFSSGTFITKLESKSQDILSIVLPDKKSEN